MRHVDGVLVAARGLCKLGYERIFVPAEDAAEAALIDGLEVIPCASLASVVHHLLAEELIPPSTRSLDGAAAADTVEHDLAEVHGQEEAKRALEVAAAGGHHLLMSGPPGAGKTMLARCLPGILPPLGLNEALDVAQVRSVLFLDELAEFQTPVLQALRQPLESGRVSITRSGGSVSYPARFMLVAATNPCPCGWTGDGLRPCRCTPAAIDTYQRRLSGPLLDRIDIQVAVRRVPLDTLASEPSGEASSKVRERVVRARRRQLQRQGSLNAQLKPVRLRQLAGLAPPSRRTLERWSAQRGMTARGFHRAWRVARTAADLDGSEQIEEHHVLEALGFRLQDVAA